MIPKTRIKLEIKLEKYYYKYLSSLQIINFHHSDTTLPTTTTQAPVTGPCPMCHVHSHNHPWHTHGRGHGHAHGHRFGHHRWHRRH